MATELETFSLWQEMTPELTERVVCFLPPNDVACTVRLINKAAAAMLSGPRYTAVCLSLPSPTHAFRQRWGSPAAMVGLTLKQRRQLVCLTARTGSIPNLEVAAANVGWHMDGTVFEAAASAAQLHVCQWLRDKGYPFGNALIEAARAGQRAVCEWLLANGCAWTKGAVYAAASEGHTDLMFWMLECRPEHACEPVVLWLLAQAAKGCDLPTLQRLQLLLLGEGQTLLDFVEEDQEDIECIIDWAASSPTPDWQAKIVWAEALGYPKSDDACEKAAACCPDAVERLAWLQQRGYTVDSATAGGALQAGRVDVLRSLLADGVRPNPSHVRHAAYRGHLAAVALVCTDGSPMDLWTFKSAAEGGQLPVMQWLVETLGVEPRLVAEVFTGAAKSGNLALLSWLREHGCRWDEGVFTAAAAAGNEAALVWLVEQGCPMPEDCGPYKQAALNGDEATLRCLRRLGCPWNSHGTTFSYCVGVPTCRLPMLRCLLEVGCPVDWDDAIYTAECIDRGDVASWLRRQRQQAP